MIQDYVSYFRNHAVKNKKIKHVPAAESDNHTVVGERRFTLFNMEDVAKAVKTAMWDGPALHLHIYDWSSNGSSAAEMKRYFTGGFLVTKKVQKNDTASQLSAYSECEQIVESILAKTRLDERNATLTGDCLYPFRMIEWDKLEVNAAGPLFDNRYGWWVQFPFLKKSNDTINDSLANQEYLP